MSERPAHHHSLSTADTQRHLRSANLTYFPYRVSGSTLTVVGRSQLLARWPGTFSVILSRIQRAAQTVLGVYLCSLPVYILVNKAVYKVLLVRASSVLPANWRFLTVTRYTNPRTHSLTIASAENDSTKDTSPQISR